MENDQINVDLEVPFKTKRLAEIVYHVLRVDAEPKRSGVTKSLLIKDNILIVHFSGKLAKQLRVAVNGFFESINLVTETINFTGEPVSKSYSYL